MKLSVVIGQWCLKTIALVVALLGTDIHVGAAYEVWLTDQSDSAKDSGGYLHIYDGAQLAAKPSSAKPAQNHRCCRRPGQVLRGGDQESGSPSAHAIFQRQARSRAHFLPERPCTLS